MYGQYIHNVIFDMSSKKIHIHEIFVVVKIGRRKRKSRTLHLEFLPGIPGYAMIFLTVGGERNQGFGHLR